MALVSAVTGVSVWAALRPTQTTTGTLTYVVRNVEATLTGSAWYDDNSSSTVSTYSQVISASTTQEQISTWGIGALNVPDYPDNNTGRRKFTIQLTIANTSSSKAINVKLAYTSSSLGSVSRDDRTGLSDGEYWTAGITIAASGSRTITIVYSWDEDVSVSGLNVGFTLNMVGVAA